ncbi:conserved hypothetical protein [Denitrovibrio acetiphilus DSM 12809]|uniref:Cbb3-type cytochrome oxidase component n=1 Tax=Denitrovibrio acetiphilus (strain DSM 12809 / NBRC 114555 / N2460) TaxID=522772 RepID=D4H8G1_DENA2|nr:CcoQ/FixQ family Cbb3-type cytochrome c oxidase assembly chaperone [Denitrovibrio acetiphilus]ADD68310.1 conserved hypothetical protein [Denitrovibrio acetiphilus DSM 12809]
MLGTPLSYFIYGLVLVLVFAGIIAYNYSKKNKSKIEQAKYDMMDDDDED